MSQVSNNPDLAAADFDGDGNLDVAMATQLASFNLYIGKGDGTFQAPVNIPFPRVGVTGSWSLAAGDFNGDGKPDLAVANAGMNGEGRIYIYLNTSK